MSMEQTLGSPNAGKTIMSEIVGRIINAKPAEATKTIGMIVIKKMITNKDIKAEMNAAFRCPPMRQLPRSAPGSEARLFYVPDRPPRAFYRVNSFLKNFRTPGPLVCSKSAAWDEDPASSSTKDDSGQGNGEQLYLQEEG